MTNSGYSKYDDKGNVVYSETRTKNGGYIKHYYDYDELNRRVCYSKMYAESRDYDEVDCEPLFEETTYYVENNMKVIKSIWYDTNIYMIKHINKFGREIYTKTIDLSNRTSVTKVYDPVHNTYTTYSNIEVFLNFELLILSKYAF